MKKTGTPLVFLDAGTVDYGDLSLEAYSKIGPFTRHHATPAAKVIERAAGFPIVLTNKCVMSASVLESLPGLELIALSATGYNNVDLAAARRLGVAVCNVSGYSTESVVQSTFAFLLALAGNLVKLNDAAHKRWHRAEFFMLPERPVREVHGKTLAIVGYGQIGRRVAAVAKALGMKVVVAGIPGRKYSARSDRSSLDRALAAADFVSLHAPLSPLTERIINARTLAKMKKGSYLINMARGGLVDERALRRALDRGHLAGAASDVLSQEPPPAGHPLLNAPNLLLSPHMAWGSLEARRRLVAEMELNIRAFLAGRRRNRVEGL